MSDFEYPLLGTDDLQIDDSLDRIVGIMIPERVIQEVLTAGFAALGESPDDLVDDLFFKLDSTARKDIKDFFTAHPNIRVRLNFPRDDYVFPMVAVLNTADSEDVSNTLLDDFLSAGFDAAMTTRYRVVGVPINSEYQIFCLSDKDSNAALWMYYVARAILQLNGDLLISHGMHNVIMGGRDITLREDLFPELTYARVLTLTCLNYFSLRLTEEVTNKLVLRTFAEHTIHGKTQLNVEDP